MIVVKLNNSKNITEKLPTILDDAMSRKENHIVLMTEKEWHEEVCLVVKNHKKDRKSNNVWKAIILHKRNENRNRTNRLHDMTELFKRLVAWIKGEKYTKPRRRDSKGRFIKNKL